MTHAKTPLVPVLVIAGVAGIAVSLAARWIADSMGYQVNTAVVGGVVGGVLGALVAIRMNRRPAE